MDADIVVIDPGVDFSHSILKNADITCLRLGRYSKKIVEDESKDELGHGMSVCGIILSHCNFAKIILIKAFDLERDYADYDDLVYILKYIYENINCKIINMSLGLAVIENS